MNISASNISNPVVCPTSKSYANRALILASLKKGPVRLLDMPTAQDTRDMISVLRKIGLDIIEDKSDIVINNSFPACEKFSSIPKELFLGEGGTTVRFLYALLALGQNEYHLKFAGEIENRPMTELFRCLDDLGAKKVSLGLIKGPIYLNSSIEVDCSETTQFASALMHLSLVSDIQVVPTNVSGSKKYLEMTRLLVETFKKESEYRVPVDYSSASYLISYALVNQDIKVSNLHEEDPFQADSVLVEISKSIGGSIIFSADGALISKCLSFSRGIEVDGANCIDLVPTLMFLAAFIPYKSVIKNIKALRFKECDRLEEMQKILAFFNVNFHYNADTDIFTIFPSAVVARVYDLTVADDHRMVMVASLFFKTLGGGEIHPAWSVNKSFPGFFEIFA
jgi:3-phosphoshikimate 1-carboxyvinyltransferase